MSDGYRITQQIVEGAAGGPATARCSQQVVEVAQPTTATGRYTQQVVEWLRGGSGTVRWTHQVVEVLYQTPTPTPLGEPGCATEMPLEAGSATAGCTTGMTP